MVNNNHSHAGSPSCPSVRPSIFSEVERVKAQVWFVGFGVYVTGRDGEWEKDANGQVKMTFDPIFGEVCLIIAEVNLMNPQNSIKVAGEVMPVGIVQEVFGKLTHDHIRRTVDNFTHTMCEVINKKAYLRTALYNAVFELNIGTANELAQDGFLYRV